MNKIYKLSLDATFSIVENLNKYLYKKEKKPGL